HRFANRVWSIGDSIAGVWFPSEQHVAIAARRVEVSAGCSDSKCRDQHSRPNDYTFVDRIPQRDIHKFLAADKTAAEVAHGCESRFHGCPRIFCGRDRMLGNVFANLLEAALIIIAGKIERQMGVAVHESW